MLMKYLTSNQLRRMWIDFFTAKGALHQASAPLVPFNDPSLLWINAGVTPLKKYFDGSETPLSRRLVSVQKCIRTNDIENVGITPRHHTFFEMLGNFSVGDYFKTEAISWAYELLTSEQWFAFDINKLFITYYPDDKDTYNLWLKLGVNKNHLVPSEDNFWEIGQGPSGPCTEIYYYRGTAKNKKTQYEFSDIDKDEYVEIWNIVFSSFNATPGLARQNYPELPSKNIDTGAGLERLLAIFQNAPTNFETDLFLPIIKKLSLLSGIDYHGQASFKVIADHIKTIVMALVDGAMFASEGRGYVLRRLLRRSVKHGLSLGLNKPFLTDLVDDVKAILGDFYTLPDKSLELAKSLIKQEETKFHQTIGEGEKKINSLLESAKTISGKDAFLLFDTYGFPLELTVEYANEKGVKVDCDEFEKELLKQQERSRNAQKSEQTMNLQNEAFLSFTDECSFDYHLLTMTSTVIKVFDNGLVLDKTPFYAESGGQVGDKGTIDGEPVLDTIKLPHGQALCVLKNPTKFKEGQKVVARVNESVRNNTAKNHSATHLLQKALQDQFGTHLHQQGSKVNDEYLRFDFNHFDAILPEDILAVERAVKRQIKANYKVDIKLMPKEDALKLGAMHLFSEKYDSLVRVVKMGDYSLEFCGGTHVLKTGAIGDFSVIDLSTIGSGIYRIIATTDKMIIPQLTKQLEPLFSEEKVLLAKLTKPLAKKPKLLPTYQTIINYKLYIEELRQEVKLAQKQNLSKLAQTSKEILISQIKSDSCPCVCLENCDINAFKESIDEVFNEKKLDSIFLVTNSCEKYCYLLKTKNPVANQKIKLINQLLNGRGGGNHFFAQGSTGEKVTSDLLSQVKTILNND